MKFSTGMVALIATATMMPLTAQAAERITFEDVPLNPIYPDNPGMSFSELVTGGYLFTSPVRVTAIFFPRDLGSSEGDGKYLASTSDQFGGPVSFSPVGEATFDLLSADVAELFWSWSPVSNFYSVEFKGLKEDGSFIEKSFVLDGFTAYYNDFPQTRKSFETVEFVGWTNLKAVTVSGVDRLGGKGDFAIDNIVTNRNAVPEPGTWALMILGFGAVGYAMRRKTVLRFV